MPTSARPPVLIVGMARSGTTLTAEIFAQLGGVHVEMEPHLLWKAGDFHRLADEEPTTRDAAARYVRRTLMARAGAKRLVEKSPPNILRPELVKAAFPEARVVIVDREPAPCIRSNLQRSRRGHGWNFALSLRRYGGFATRATKTKTDLPLARRRLAAWQQIRLRDAPGVLAYMGRMAELKRRGLLPFGPKLERFWDVVRDEGFLGYHVRVHRRWCRHRRTFLELYGDQAAAFRLETLLATPAEVRRLLDFAGVTARETGTETVTRHFRHEPALRRDDADLHEIERRLADDDLRPLAQA